MVRIARLGFIAALIAGSCGAALAAAAESYPVRPVRFILPFPPGGPTDILARVFGQKLGDNLGQQVVIDNRGGAGGIIACEIAMRAAPDGYTIMLGAVGTLAINPHLYAKVPYNPQRDFRPVSLLAATPYVLLVSPSIPARSVKELIAYARARPGQLNFGSGGVGTGNHLSGELFKLAADLDLAHVPYKGANLAIPDLLAGQVHMLFLNVLPALPHVKAGRLRALAVTSGRRSPSAPDIPTMAEAGIPGYETSSWHGVVVPAKTAAGVVKRVHAELSKIARQPEVKERLEAQGAEVIGSTPEEFAAWIRSENAKWSEVIRAAGIRAE